MALPMIPGWNRSMKKAVWLSYDLGVKGDYDSLYAYLDNAGAVECGDNLAFFQVDFSGTDAELEAKITQELTSSLTLGKNDRIYLIYRRSDGKIGGKFLFGSRKATPWQGFGQHETSEDDGL